MKYIISGACKSVIGKVRVNNEDNYLFNHKILKVENTGSNLSKMKFSNSDCSVNAIFDGIGGEKNGEKASFIAAKALKEYIESNVNKTFSWNTYINNANEKILDEKINGGTTMAGILFTTNNILICNLGDSRIYGYKNGILTQLSVDHTDEKVQQKLNIKINGKASLTQNLGISPDILTLDPYTEEYKINEFEKILICSDGLTDMVDNDRINELLAMNKSSSCIVKKLIEEAMNNGGIDNTTVMVFRIKKSMYF